MTKKRSDEDYYRSLVRKRSSGAILLPFKGKYLVMKDTRGRWGLVGGSAENLEAPHETAIREAKEEIGIDVMIDRLLLLGYTKCPDDSLKGDAIHATFLGKELTQEEVDAIKIDPEELSGVFFLTREEIARIGEKEDVEVFKHAA